MNDSWCGLGVSEVIEASYGKKCKADGAGIPGFVEAADQSVYASIAPPFHGALP
jgi:hypothetical protein